MGRKPWSWGANTFWFEVFTVWMAVSWGLVLMLPGDTFQTTKAYSLLQPWGESNWALFVFGVASLKISGLLLGFITFGGWFRLVGSSLAFMFWSLLGVLLYLGNPIGHGWVIYASLACGNIAVAAHHALELRGFYKIFRVAKNKKT